MDHGIMDPEELRVARSTLGMTQGSLAEALGISRKTVNQMERGHTPIERSTALAVRHLGLLHREDDADQSTRTRRDRRYHHALTSGNGRGGRPKEHDPDEDPSPIDFVWTNKRDGDKLVIPLVVASIRCLKRDFEDPVYARLMDNPMGESIGNHGACMTMGWNAMSAACEVFHSLSKNLEDQTVLLDFIEDVIDRREEGLMPSYVYPMLAAAMHESRLHNDFSRKATESEIERARDLGRRCDATFSDFVGKRSDDEPAWLEWED